MQKQGNRREVVLISGKSTMGKSCFADELLYNYNRVIILDPDLEHDGKLLFTLSNIRLHCTSNPLYRVKTENVLIFENLCEFIFEQAKPNQRILFCIEEITRLNLDARLDRFPQFKRIVFAGGHTGVDLYILAQRISSIPISLRSQYTKIITFCQTEPDDLKYFKSVSQDELMQEIPRLQPREYIEITSQQIEKRRS